MPSANFKRNIKRIKAKLATDFEPAVASPTAGAVGTGKLFIAGQIFDGTIGGVTQVVNVGRPAAAQYAAKTGGSVVVSSGGGGGGTTTGGTTVDLTSLYGAPYLTVAADTALTNERTLAVSSAFALTDAGSNSTLTLALTAPGTLAHDSTNVATGSHTHAITASDAPGAAVSLLKSSAAGLLTLPQFTATTQVTTPTIETASGDLALSPFTGITTGVQFTASTKLRTPLIDTASGDLTLSPATGITTGAQFTATTKVTTPLIDTASGNLTLAPVGGTVAVTGTVNASTSVLTPSISTPSGNLFLSAVGGAVLVQPSVMLQSDDFTSQLVGWRMTYNGELDTRYIYTDQLHAKAFIADLEQALAGSQIITKSVTTVAQSFVVPYPGAALPLYVDDLPSAEDMAVFESGDFVRLREFNRAAGSLSITDCWGTVSSYTDQTDKVQRWSFTRSGTASVSTISQVGTVQTANSSGATSRSVSKVSGTASGHRMIAQVVINNTSVTITPPSGWSLLTSGTATGVKMAIYTKVAGGSEPSSYTFNFSSSVAVAVSLVCLRNVVSIYSSQVNTQSTPTNSMVGLSNLSLSTSDYYLFYGGIAGNIRGVAPDGMSEIADFGATGVGAFSAFDLLDMPGDYGDVAATLASNAAYVCITLDLIPTYSSGGLDTTSGLMAPGTVIAPDAIVLDYGVSGNGWHEVTTVDGLYGSNSPYARIASWTTHPATGAVVRTQTGHLRGLFGVANEYGFYAGSGVTTADNYLRLSSNTAQFNNIPISMYSGGTERMRINTSYGIDMYMPSVYDEVAAISWRSTLNSGTAGVRIHAHDESDATGLYLESIASGAASNKTGFIDIVAYDNTQVVTRKSEIAMLAPNVGDSYIRMYAKTIRIGDIAGTTSNIALYGTTALNGPVTLSNDLDMNGNDILDIGTIGSTWTNLSFSSGWGNKGGGNSGQYKKVGDLVFLRGYVYRSSGSDASIATLPAGYRPAANHVFPVLSNNAIARVDIGSDGIIYQYFASPTDWVSLDGIVLSTI